MKRPYHATEGWGHRLKYRLPIGLAHILDGLVTTLTLGTWHTGFSYAASMRRAKAEHRSKK